MENIVFATMLYTVVFSFLCWLTTPLPPSSHRSISQIPNIISRPTETENTAQLNDRAQTPSLSLNDLRETFAIEPEPDVEAIAQSKSQSGQNNTAPLTNIQTSETDISDIETLKLRPARKIAKQLGIQQKVNGKDQPLSWLRAQIKKRLEEEPQTTAPIIVKVLSVA